MSEAEIRIAGDLLDALLNETADDDGNGKCAYAAFGKDFLYCEAYGWLYWTGTHWTLDEGEAALDRSIFALLKQRRLAAVSAGKEAVVKATSGSIKRVRDCKAAFRSLVTVSVNEFDDDPDELNVANGVLDLRTGKLKEHSPAQRFTYCVDTEYDQRADDTEWRQFLISSVGGGQEVVDYLQMAIGYSLTGHTSEECLWYVYGPSRSGKGTFTETLLALLGPPLAVEVDFSTFTARRDGDTQNFDLAPLKPARLVFTSESNRYEMLNSGKVKQLTGGNYIRCAFKHKNHFVYRPQFATWLFSNQSVNADPSDKALWGRVKVVEFPNGHLGKEDKTLKPRMRQPESLRGVLKWAVEGAMKWYAAPNGLVHPKQIDFNTEEHRTELDYVGAWLDEKTVDAPGSYATSAELYTSYKFWCDANGVLAKSQRGLSQELKAKGYVVNEAKRIGDKVVRVTLGLNLR